MRIDDTIAGIITSASRAKRPPLTVESLQAVMDRATTTIACHPDQQDQLQSALDESELPGLYRVIASPFVPEGKAYVIPPMSASLPWNAESAPAPTEV